MAGANSASSYISSPDDDFRELRSNQLDTFIAQQLQPNDVLHSRVSKALDALCVYLRRKMQPPVSIKRCVQSGPMGKETALKNEFDSNVVVVMEDIHDAEGLIEQIDRVMYQLGVLLERHQSLPPFQSPLKEQGWKITILQQNKFMVQIELRHIETSESVKVVLSPTFDIENISREDLYQLMSTYDDNTRECCSIALAELRRGFVKDQNTDDVKALIRLVKHWCKRYLPWEDGQRMPNSYLLELITINVWQNEGGPPRFKTALLFKKVMTALNNHSQLDVTWDLYYRSSMIKATSTPRVVDPVNPHSNVYDVVRGWKRVRKIAVETLDKPLLQGL